MLVDLISLNRLMLNPLIVCRVICYTNSIKSPQDEVIACAWKFKLIGMFTLSNML